MEKSKNVPINFYLDDADGKSHHYTGTYHTFEDGSELSMTLIQLLGEPLIRGLGDLKETAQVAIGGADGAEVGSMLDNVDFAGALQALRAVPVEDFRKLAQRLLKNLFRDGQRLSNSENARHAYTANYAEWYMACGKVVIENKFIPLLSTFSESEDIEA